MDDRQRPVPGFDQKTIQRLTVTMVGAGGLGGEIGEGLVRKGVDHLKILDPDIVELSNLNRQRFFREDLDENKAIALAKNLQREGVMGSLITAFPMRFQDAVERNLDVNCDVVVCGVDNDDTRVYVSRYCREQGIPAVFTAVSEQADHGYVFIQEVEEACFGCLFPDAGGDETEPCPGTPAVKDILKVMGGIVLYAVDTLVMERPRPWNCKHLYLAETDEQSGTIELRENCPLCGQASC